ncbi:hypothetical protein [Leptolyngbya sp. FACHB-261]|uniref:hypothetical protein n=1 Tax=Leptolyngbya sp. FACHB-261 TaxID=2692806 RepID=UPI001687678D|nr:hypothetical protein [Leptolyngbya sp. FACHB-261]MBD2104937.1 hypothetical protein [Leptolyngbya sp. FACHB-261]
MPKTKVDKLLTEVETAQIAIKRRLAAIGRHPEMSEIVAQLQGEALALQAVHNFLSGRDDACSQLKRLARQPGFLTFRREQQRGRTPRAEDHQ